MRKYRISITDSKNERIPEWKELYADTAKDAAEILSRALDGDLDQVEVEEYISLTDQYATLVQKMDGVIRFSKNIRVPQAIRRAARQSKYESQARYDATNTRQIRLKLNKGTDKDVLEWLDQQPNKQGAIKALIRERIEKEG